ncbi:MAG: ferredoxin [Phycisphaerae bacterium]|nr:ferredoxin [Phycisphaerae bacterium]
MKATVTDACIGCGLCPQVCPDVFEMDDKDRAIVKVTPVPQALQPLCREAVTVCPVNAIELEE